MKVTENDSKSEIFVGHVKQHSSNPCLKCVKKSYLAYKSVNMVQRDR